MLWMTYSERSEKYIYKVMKGKIVETFFMYILFWVKENYFTITKDMLAEAYIYSLSLTLLENDYIFCWALTVVRFSHVNLKIYEGTSNDTQYCISEIPNLCSGILQLFLWWTICIYHKMMKLPFLDVLIEYNINIFTTSLYKNAKGWNSCDLNFKRECHLDTR